MVKKMRSVLVGRSVLSIAYERRLFCFFFHWDFRSSDGRNVSSSLIRLLHDPYPSVRLQTVDAISLMYN